MREVEIYDVQLLKKFHIARAAYTPESLISSLVWTFVGEQATRILCISHLICNIHNVGMPRFDLVCQIYSFPNKWF